MAALTGSPLVQPLWSTTDRTAGAVSNGRDATGYVAGILGTGTVASPGWSPFTTARTGSPLKSPIDDWYNRFFWQPQGAIAAGAIYAPEAYLLAIWNGNTAAVTLSSITPTAADGVTTDALPGDSWGGLVSRTITVTIVPTGDRSELIGYLTLVFSNGFSFIISVTGTEYGTWLAYDRAQRCILVEAQRYGSVTHYLSNLAYVSRSSDVPSNTPYDESLLPGFEMRNRIDGTRVIGEISVDNLEGDRDEWVTYQWEGWPISVYLGDLTWPRDAFQVLSTGRIEAVDCPEPSRLVFRILDKKNLLEVPVLTTRRTDGELVPLLIGQCFNVTPVIVDTGSLIYQASDGVLASVSEVRDRGVSCTFTTDLANGKFTKTSTPTAGRGGVTCDAYGSTTGDLAGIVEYLAVRGGLSTTPGVDIDYDSLWAFPNTAQLGIFIDSERTIADCLDEVMATVGGAWTFNRSGLFQVFRLDAPAATADLELDADDVEDNGLSVLSIEMPRYAVRLGYQRNYTVQDAGSLAGAVSESNRDLYTREYSIVEAVSATVKTQYPLAEEPELVGTLFVEEADAQAEADRRLALRSVKRTVYLAKCFATPFAVQLGQTVKLTYPRFGFDAGVNAVVIGMRELPTLDRVELELWR